MKKLLHSRSFVIGVAGLVILFVILMMLGVGKGEPEPVVTAVVESGSVRQLVSVSGIAEAEQTAELAFPVSGIVKEVNVSKGDRVNTGDVLITLDRQALLADRQEAVANLAQAVSQRDELLSGPTGSARNVTAETLSLKEEALQTIRENEAQKVANARRTLLSSNITAYSEDGDEDAVAPTISGTYSCDEEGTYLLEVYSSNSNSGYSYRLSGIENGTFSASVDQAIAMGKCGLRIQFDPNSTYGRTQWKIDIPNTKSATYVTNRNAYALAQTQAESAIKVAEQDVLLAEANATNNNAPARDEAVTQANARIAQAQARLSRIDATINDRVLTAPFSGTVTEIDILPGETVTAAPVVTLLAEADFEVTARIPEIDIGKLFLGQKVEMVFDARSTETLVGEISFISLKATEIDGVSYYEAIVSLSEVPDWIRSGLNADIDIIITEVTDTLRVPKRFITETDGVFTVQVQSGQTIATTTIDVLLEGNDGFVALTGITSGTTVVAP